MEDSSARQTRVDPRDHLFPEKPSERSCFWLCLHRSSGKDTYMTLLDSRTEHWQSAGRNRVNDANRVSPPAVW